MRHYKINTDEYNYLYDMMEWMKEHDQGLSEEGQARMKDVFGRIASRPVMDIILDSSVLGDITNKEKNIMNEVTKVEASVEDYLTFIKADDDAGSVAYLESFFDKTEEGQAAMRAFVDKVVESATEEATDAAPEAEVSEA